MAHDPGIVLSGPRVRLRPWGDDDLAPFAALNADQEAMRFFVSPLNRDESDLLAARIRSNFSERGFGLWALDVPTIDVRAIEVHDGEPADFEFAGFVGLAFVGFEAPFNDPQAPVLEIGWRLKREAWGHGYATEGAQLVLDHAFGVLKRDEVVSFTALSNTPSTRVMERIGLQRAIEFDHPRLPGAHPLRRHVLYRTSSERWKALRSPANAPQGQGRGAGEDQKVGVLKSASAPTTRRP